MRKGPHQPIFKPGKRRGQVVTGAQIGLVPVTVTINQGGSQTDPTSDLPIVFDVVFSEAVTGFTSGDLVLSGTATPTAASVSGSGATYTVEVTAVTQPGTVIVSIPGGVATSIASGTSNSAATSSDNEVTYVVYPAEFVFANGWHGVNTSLLPSDFVDIPPDPGWLPGDYAIVHARNTNGGTLTLPSWLTRLDGGAATDNPVVAGGFITDGLEFAEDRFGSTGTDGDMATGIRITFSEGTPAARQQVVAVFRNPSAAGATGTVIEAFDDSPANLDVGPIDVVDDGMGVLVGSASASGTATFITTATPLLVNENNGRLHRVFGVGGPAAGYSFAHDGVSGASLSASNVFYAMALAPGPLGYDPQGTISYVGAGTDTVSSTGTTLAVNMPSGMNAGDLILVVTHANDNSGDGFQEEAGWLRVGRYFNHARDVKIFMKRAVGGGGDSLTLDASVNNTNRQAKAFAYRNVAGVQSTAGNNISAGGTITMTPPWNTRVANTVAIAASAYDFYAPTGITTANGYTSRAMVTQASGGGLEMADKTISSPGAPGFPVFSQGSGPFASVFLIYLLPA